MWERNQLQLSTVERGESWPHRYMHYVIMHVLYMHNYFFLWNLLLGNRPVFGNAREKRQRRNSSKAPFKHWVTMNVILRLWTKVRLENVKLQNRISKLDALIQQKVCKSHLIAIISMNKLHVIGSGATSWRASYDWFWATAHQQCWLKWKDWRQKRGHS